MLPNAECSKIWWQLLRGKIFVTETHQQTCPGRPQEATGPDANAIIYLLIKHNLCNIWSQVDFVGGGGAVSKSASEFTYVYTRIHKPEPQTRRVTYGRR